MRTEQGRHIAVRHEPVAQLKQDAEYPALERLREGYRRARVSRRLSRRKDRSCLPRKSENSMSIAAYTGP